MSFVRLFRVFDRKFSSFTFRHRPPPSNVPLGDVFQKRFPFAAASHFLHIYCLLQYLSVSALLLAIRSFLKSSSQFHL